MNPLKKVNSERRTGSQHNGSEPSCGGYNQTLVLPPLPPSAEDHRSHRMTLPVFVLPRQDPAARPAKIAVRTGWSYRCSSRELARRDRSSRELARRDRTGLDCTISKSTDKPFLSSPNQDLRKLYLPAELYLLCWLKLYCSCRCLTQ